MTEHQWRKSGYSGTQGGACVEVARTPDTTHIRDSKNPHQPHLHIPTARWQDFLHHLKNRPR